MTPKVLLGTEATAVLRHLHLGTKRRVKTALHDLKEAWPRPAALDVKQLRREPTDPPIYRLRVGDWRVIFRPSGADLQVVRVFHRRDGYDWLERD